MFETLFNKLNEDAEIFKKKYELRNFLESELDDPLEEFVFSESTGLGIDTYEDDEMNSPEQIIEWADSFEPTDEDEDELEDFVLDELEGNIIF